MHSLTFLSYYLTVPMKSTGSWGMMASLLRRSFRPICAILTPSIATEPPASSTSLNRATEREDFPADTHRKILWEQICGEWMKKKKAENAGGLEKERITHTWSCAPHNADGLFRQDGEGQVLKHQRKIITITHLYILEGDLSLLRPGGGRSSCLRTLSGCFTL